MSKLGQTVKVRGGGGLSITYLSAAGDSGSPVSVPARTATALPLNWSSDAAWTINGSGALVVPADGVYVLMLRIGVSTIGTSGYELASGSIGSNTTGCFPLDPTGATNCFSNLVDIVNLNAGDLLLPEINTEPDSAIGNVWAWVEDLRIRRLA